MEKRATRANLARNATEIGKTLYERGKESEKESGRKEVERASMREGEKEEREEKRRGRRMKVGPRNNHVRGALLISAFVHLRPPR